MPAFGQRADRGEDTASGLIKGDIARRVPLVNLARPDGHDKGTNEGTISKSLYSLKDLRHL
jgi:hypothetical protein